MYIGTARYNANAYLVEFDPKTEQQKIVIDAHKELGLKATGYAAQAKIHTRNFVRPSGRIYVGTQEGYRNIPGDVSVYPGGYVMRFDPKTKEVESLGVPYPSHGNVAGKGVIDVVADETRGILYIVTTKDNENKGKSYWAIGDIKTKTYRPFNIEATNYGTTLMDDKGRAHVITADSRIATYDPKTKKVSLRDIVINGVKWKQKTTGAIPVWQLTPDRKGAYIMFLDADATLHQFDFSGNGKVKGRSLGQLLPGKNFDTRSSLTVASDGRVYGLIKSDNETGFGQGGLHHLVRYDPKTKKTADLGVLAVSNPDFYDFSPDKQRPGASPYTYTGFQKLPDGTLTPSSVHQGLIAAKDGTLYALILYPYTLLKIDNATGLKNTVASAQKLSTAPAQQQYAAYALSAADAIEKNTAELVRVSEIIADKLLQNGMIGAVFHQQSLEEEVTGRSGGLLHMGFDRAWSKDRTPEMDRHNVALVGWERAPGEGDLAQLQKLKEAGTYIVGFGPRGMTQLAEHVKLCDAFFDTGLANDDRVVTLPNGTKAGRANLLVNMLNAWALQGEVVAALTRKGKMPTMWKSWMYPDGKDWSNKYYQKVQWHDEFDIAPIAAGVLSRAYLNEIRANVNSFKATQSTLVSRAADMIADEMKAGRKTIVATQGHAPWRFVGQTEDAKWGILSDFDGGVPAQVENHRKTPDGALVLRLGKHGLRKSEAAVLAEKNQRVILVTVPTPVEEFIPPAGLPLVIDMQWKYGDAAIPIENYPIKILPASGVMQVVAYESINTEVLARLP